MNPMLTAAAIVLATFVSAHAEELPAISANPLDDQNIFLNLTNEQIKSLRLQVLKPTPDLREIFPSTTDFPFERPVEEWSTDEQAKFWSAIRDAGLVGLKLVAGCVSNARRCEYDSSFYDEGSDLKQAGTVKQCNCDQLKCKWKRVE